jgi:hypothetical protein
VSEPEAAPEGGAAQEEPGRRGFGRWRGAPRPEDLRPRAFPLGDWGRPADRLAEVYRWSEEGALCTVDWYLRDRAAKRRAARALRAGAAVATTVGAALPLARLAGDGPPAAWGYLALLLAGACVAMDRTLGLTAGWMRDMATAQAVQRRIEALRFEWAAESVREMLGPTEGTAAEATERCLAILRRFGEDVAELVRAETSDWMAGFGAGAAAGPLRTQVPPRREQRPVQRLALPGARPQMPRQRPPEPPR